MWQLNPTPKAKSQSSLLIITKPWFRKFQTFLTGFSCPNPSSIFFRTIVTSSFRNGSCNFSSAVKHGTGFCPTKLRISNKMSDSVFVFSWGASLTSISARLRYKSLLRIRRQIILPTVSPNQFIGQMFDTKKLNLYPVYYF